MIEITEHTRNVLLEVAKKKKIYVEGNFLKLLKAPKGDKEFEEYLSICKEKDTTARRKRLSVTKQVQSQNKELEQAAKDNEQLLLDLQVALDEAKTAEKEAQKLKDEAVEDLDILQKRTQFELIGLIVKVALIIIIGVGVTTTLLYSIAMLAGKDTTLLGNAWSNMFGILLTNSFSIIGTIMGVKYATEKSE
tara:strand:+ start:91 stop:666 length:576 start_codon:yes stop_codon:yes gene_type:complete